VVKREERQKEWEAWEDSEDVPGVSTEAETTKCESLWTRRQTQLEDEEGGGGPVVKQEDVHQQIR